MQKVQQFWNSMWQAWAKSAAPSTSIEAPPSKFALALFQLVLWLEKVFAVELQRRKSCSIAILYQACMTSVQSPLCSYGLGHQTAKHMLIHSRNFLAVRHTIRDNQGWIPNYKDIVKPQTELRNISRCMIQRRRLGQRARGLLNPPEPPYPANDWAGLQS
jgi:hypothetical protein